MKTKIYVTLCRLLYADTLMPASLCRRKKQRQIRRLARKEKETDDSKDPACKYEGAGVSAEMAPVKQRGRAEGDEDSKDKDKDVEHHKASSDNSRVRIKDHDYGAHSEQCGEQPGTKIAGEGSPVLIKIDKSDHKEVGEKQQLKVFPYRFVDRTKKSGYWAFAGPLVNKMIQASEHDNCCYVRQVCLVI